jgi:alkanesulfonate monooxygenase SsuD/methylene tetrahydromethanopterin reductase-like flavin-dependent oxidoreductase (luciferase family)
MAALLPICSGRSQFDPLAKGTIAWLLAATTGCMAANRFKLGLFGLNCSGGMTMTKAPERWEASWENNIKATRMAEAAGLEFVLPIARWHGYRGETDTEGTTFETLTWAAGLLSATTDIVAFGTVHVPLINPIFAAKQCVTADSIGQGRFGLNRLRLERRRVRNVRRAAARAR